MEKNRNQKHTKETFYYAISRMLERGSYYGLRILIILHMTGIVLKMERTEALSIMGWFTGSIVVSQILGALLGDLIIGNKKAIIFGGIIQAFGAFTLCITSTTGIYIGLFLVVLGSGFYTPNIISNFGKLYLNKTKLLDSGFTIFYLAINLGSFLGMSLIGYFGEEYGYNIGFIISGILMLISIIPILISKDKIEDKKFKNEFPMGKRILNISLAFIVVGLFWGIYQISYIRISDLQFEFSEISSLNIPKHLWQTINSTLILPISIIAIIVWTFFYSTQFFKLMIGFIFGAISYGIIYLIPGVPTEKHTILYIIALLFLGIAEIHIAPIIHSILTKYSNPKYLAILISLAFIPTRLFGFIFGLFNDRFYDNPTLGIKLGIIAMVIISVGLIVYVFWEKKNYLQQRV
ncbi:POT-type proton-dependent oligopeptide transporter [Psychroserpens ponticola]|uniref:MFS transporter n=1 Tax=Psychroserpens ponticola TaxID=2932268 RepID=A0ABY7S542_9FLAO|nr:MFS transporter [Psychroserpens ponticola]WCO03526.1 MFS transporter [Psychroserpens ponticola]